MFSKLLRYAITGLVTFGIYLLAGFLLDELEVPLVWLAPIAFTVAVSANYVLQKIWVFKDNRPVVSSLPKFFFMISVGYFVNSFMLATLAPKMSLILAQIPAAFAVILTNALFAFLWVFNKNEKYQK